MEDSKNKDISVSKLETLELEIVKFDKVLDRIQTYFPEDTRVWDFIADSRTALFRLQQAIHGLDIIDFTRAFEKPWWVGQFIEEGNKGKEVA